MLSARDLMTETPVTVDPMTTVKRAIELLHTLDIRHLPVVSEDRELVGMISDRDLRVLAVPYVGGVETMGDAAITLDAKVASLMKAEVLSVEASADASEVVDLMIEHKIGAVPVTDADGTLVGIISYVDVLRAFRTTLRAPDPR